MQEEGGTDGTTPLLLWTEWDNSASTPDDEAPGVTERHLGTQTHVKIHPEKSSSTEPLPASSTNHTNLSLDNISQSSNRCRNVSYVVLSTPKLLFQQSIQGLDYYSQFNKNIFYINTR